MIPIENSQTPATAASLREAIEREIRRWITLGAQATPIQIAGELPRLQSMSVDLSRGILDTSRGLPAHELITATGPDIQVDSPAVSAKPLIVDGIAVEFDLTASGAVFNSGLAQNGQWGLEPENAVDGRLSVRMTQQDLEAAILNGARAGAASSGVAIQRVEANLTSINAHTVDVHLKIAAKKFVSTVIRVSGRLSVDDQLQATASNLKVEGDGMVGSIAVGFIRPHLEKLQGQSISLMQFSLGRIRLRDVVVLAYNGLRITAAFGGDPA